MHDKSMPQGLATTHLFVDMAINNGVGRAHQTMSHCWWISHAIKPGRTLVTSWVSCCPFCWGLH